MKASHIKVPEDFQKKVGDLLAQCTTKAHMNYLRSCCNEQEADMSKDEKKEFSSEDMPD